MNDEIDTRSGKAGKRLGQAIREMAHMMYNQNTKDNFYNALIGELEDEYVVETELDSLDLSNDDIEIDSAYDNGVGCPVTAGLGEEEILEEIRKISTVDGFMWCIVDNKAILNGYGRPMFRKEVVDTILDKAFELSSLENSHDVIEDIED